jgi:hypothetical protein
MLKKLLVTSLIAVILTPLSGVNTFAQTVKTDENQAVAKQAAATNDLKAVVNAKSKSGEVNVSNKSTLAEYERSKRQGKGLSTTTKVLIITGIAAAVVTIIFVAGRKDLENNILR